MKKIIILLLIACLFAMPIIANESQVEIPKQEKTLANNPFMVMWFFLGGFVVSMITKEIIVDGAYGARK